MKATGQGLAMPLHSFAVDPDTPRLLFAPSAESWTLRSWTLAEHALAIAVQGDCSGLEVACERVERLGAASPLVRRYGRSPSIQTPSR